MRHPSAGAAGGRQLTTPVFILNTRPAVYRGRMEAAFAPISVPLVHWPLFHPRATGVALPPAGDFDAIIFTSQMAVSAVPADWHGHPAFAVGEGTAEAARHAGFRNVIQTGETAADMVQTLKTAAFGRALYASGRDITADLAVTFPEKVERLAVYEMVAEDHVPEEIAARLTSGRAIVPLFSRRAAVQLAKVLADAGLQNCAIEAVGLSAGVLEAAQPWRMRHVAAAPTLAGIVATVQHIARDKVSP